MSEHETEVPENVDPATGEVLDTEPNDETPEPQPDEAPDPADDDDETPAPEPEQQPDDGPSLETQFKDMEKAQASLERENTRHRNRVSEILGENAQGLLPCPLCAGFADGMIPPVQPPDDVVEAVKQALGLAPDAEYQEAKHAHRCEACGGLGGVISGSLVSGNEIIRCDGGCNGSGYIIEGQTLAPVVPLQTNGAPPADMPAGLNPDDPFAVEARERGYMVIQMPQAAPPAQPDQAFGQ